MEPSIRAGSNHVFGTVSLSYIDHTFGLLVSSEQFHHTYTVPPYGDDGLFCFDNANYELLQSVFLQLLSAGAYCEIVFTLQDMDQGGKSLYSAKFYHDAPVTFADIWLPHYDDTPGIFNHDFSAQSNPVSAPALAKQTLDLLYGGFLAAEIDALGSDPELHAQSAPVKLFRKAMEQSQDPDHFFNVLDATVKPSLSQRVQSAQCKTNARQKPVKELLTDREEDHPR